MKASLYYVMSRDLHGLVCCAVTPNPEAATLPPPLVKPPTPPKPLVLLAPKVELPWLPKMEPEEKKIIRVLLGPSYNNKFQCVTFQ